MLDELFKDKKLDFQRLADFGFSKTPGGYGYSTTIVDGQFRLDITVSNEGGVHTDVIELSGARRTCCIRFKAYTELSSA